MTCVEVDPSRSSTELINMRDAAQQCPHGVECLPPYKPNVFYRGHSTPISDLCSSTMRSNEFCDQDVVKHSNINDFRNQYASRYFKDLALKVKSRF